MTKARIAALELLPPDGAWMTIQSGARGKLRPEGVSLAIWDRILMRGVPDSFWKPEFDEGDGRNGRVWVVFDEVKRTPDGSKSRRYRLTKAGMALLAQYA